MSSISISAITTTAIKNGSLVLPNRIRKAWADKGELVLIFEKDRLVVQPLEAEWQDYESKLKRVGRKISPTLINEAVSWARRSAK